MKKQRSLKLELLAITISMLVVVISAVDMFGQPARLVQILTIVAGSLAAGISAGKLIERIRREREIKSTTHLNK